MPSRFEASIDLVMKDRAHAAGSSDPLGWAATGATKVWDGISSITPSLINIPSKKEFDVVQRDGVTAATRAMIHNTINAQWVEKGPGRIVNIIPKAATAIIEAPDAIIRDGLHVIGGGGPNDGYMVKVRDSSYSQAA